MKEVCYEFLEIESDAAFQSLARSFGGVLTGNTIHFKNKTVTGQLTKINLEQGLWLRSWSLTTYRQICLHRMPATPEDEKKFSLIYFLDPSLFQLKQQRKKVRVNSQHNTMFLSNEVMMDFSVIPKHPFYVLDITFTVPWLVQQLGSADSCFNSSLHQFINNTKNPIITNPCNPDEYRGLQELQTPMLAQKEDRLFIRSRVYKMVCCFFDKVISTGETKQAQGTVQYDQLVRAERIIIENLKAVSNIKAIAKSVNMSVSTLLRQFKKMYGKSIHAYYIEKKMEVAKEMMISGKMNVKEMAAFLGYKQASPFIEAFKKLHGFSPGSFNAYR
jgi:AraC-like DNA-binding protein